MRFAYLSAAILASFTLFTASAQVQAPPSGSQTSALTAEPQDAGALAVISKVLSAVGGVDAIRAITDYKATGNITYHFGQDVPGTVTVEGKGLNEYRLDSTLPGGVFTDLINFGVMTRGEGGHPLRLQGQAPMSPATLALPYFELAFVANSPNILVADKGLVQVDGNAVRDIQIQNVVRGVADPYGSIVKYRTTDFFIDPASSLIVMKQDVVYNNIVRQLRYSNYTQEGQVLLPLAISEQRSSRPMWQMQLSQVNFNVGLQASDFQL